MKLKSSENNQTDIFFTNLRLGGDSSGLLELVFDKCSHENDFNQNLNDLKNRFSRFKTVH